MKPRASLFPADHAEETYVARIAKAAGPFAAAYQRLQLKGDASALLAELYLPLAMLLDREATTRQETLIVGLAGGQGAGKTTLCSLLESVLRHGFDRRVARFSIDDLYLTKAQRMQLSQEVHPLLYTRGVPGTHDTALGRRLLGEFRHAGPGVTVRLPAFDKSLDDRQPKGKWKTIVGPIDLVLFEGWCIGARPQSKHELASPVNVLERGGDRDGTWRHYVNLRLTTDYKDLFAQIDRLIFLAVPDFSCVVKWRGKQEQTLARKTGRPGMTEAELQHFVNHYERLTRHMLHTMPSYADLVMFLDRKQNVVDVRISPEWPR